MTLAQHQETTTPLCRGDDLRERVAPVVLIGVNALRRMQRLLPRVGGLPRRFVARHNRLQARGVTWAGGRTRTAARVPL